MARFRNRGGRGGRRNTFNPHNNNNNNGNNNQITNRHNQNNSHNQIGNRQNGGNNNNNHNHNHNQNNNNGQKCQHCGKTNHTSDKCFKNPARNNQKTGQGNHNNNNHDNIKSSKRSTCLRCGWFGHDQKICTASELPDFLQCTCGCSYHKSDRCPWSRDPSVRETAQNKDGGKICQWCKSEGDGSHDFTDCTYAAKFRREVHSAIVRSYDGLLWCWHCGAENHKTRACEKQVAEMGRIDWEAKINAIVNEWVDQDFSDLSMVQRYVEPGEDVDMSVPGSELTAPVSADFMWCIHCQNFGHHTGEENCDTLEYEARCPKRFKNTDLTKRPYVPRPRENQQDFVRFEYEPSSNLFVSGRTRSKTRESRLAALQSAKVMAIRCPTPGCANTLYFPIKPAIWGNQVQCTTCHVWHSHPYSAPRKDSKAELLKEIRKVIEITTGASAKRRLLKMKRGIEKWEDPYTFRPSLALPTALAVDRWPDMQPIYDDLGTIPEDSETEEPLFRRKNGVVIFNDWGNWQTYFPPIQIRLTSQDKAIQNNDEWAINRAGRLGFVLKCMDCGTVGVVKDAEGDHVMCGVDVGCTAGCGYGVAEWDKLVQRDSCRCVTITGRKGRPEWVLPQR